MDVKALKKSLRQQVLQQRSRLSEAQREMFSTRANHHLLSLDGLAECETIMAFYPFRDEMDTRPFLTAAMTRGQKLLLPLTDRENKRLHPYLYTGEHCLRQGAYGIFEPDPAKAPSARTMQINAVIVPGSAFDQHGGRLGYGGGYYDRFLAGLTYRPLLIGLAFSVQQVERLPLEPHDYRMDYLVTEKGVQCFS